MPTPPISDEELHKTWDVYRQTGGNKRATARILNIERQTVQHRIKQCHVRYGWSVDKMFDGEVEARKIERLPLPPVGQIAHYIITSAQNNTRVHPGWKSLLRYVAFLDGQEKSSCRLFVGTYSYQIDAYGKKAVKRGKFRERDDSLWYAEEVVPYINDDSLEIAPGLIWAGEMNILPTQQNPLTRLETYNGRASNIVPHAKFAMESVASLADEATKFNYSTGTITLRNYIQKRTGIIAEREHNYGALHVEVDSSGNWYVRQLEIMEDDGVFYDLGPGGTPVRITPRSVKAQGKAQRFVKGITWFDIHVAEMYPWVRKLAWGEGGILDTLRPKYQFCHDIFSMRSASHHELKNFHRTFEKMVTGENIVQNEMKDCAGWLMEAARPWTETVVVPSNHHRHLSRWLNEADPKRDPVNALYYMQLQTEYLKALAAQDTSFDILEYALRDAGLKGEFNFLAEDQSFVICRDGAHGGIECSLHGDLGPNGARGSTVNLTRLGRKVNKGHDHRATWRGSVLSVGASSLSFPYMKGPHGHSITFAPVFENGARQLVTLWQGKYLA